MSAVAPQSQGAYDYWLDAKKVCVIGAGTMGSGIAAHLANIGFDVTLLDMTRESATEAFDRAKAARPPHMYIPSMAENIRLGGVRDDLHLAAEADWVCEAVVEKMDVKRELFKELDAILREETMVTTNTSGLQINLLAEGRSERFRRRFMGTHFFNPPRYLKLLELIPTEETDIDAVNAMARFLEEKVARRVVVAKDTPGFIANRFGMWSMIHAIHTTEKLHLSVEDVDGVTGQFLGRPRSASFRLNDLVGLDIMADIAKNLRERCPEDPHKGALELPRSMVTLISRGWIGDKVARGYYAKEGRELMAFDLQTLAYRMKQDPSGDSIKELSKLPLGERIGKALELRDQCGEFLRSHLVPVLRYADYLKEEISHSVLDFDRVMMWGFGWEMGPFAMIDAIGPEKLGLPDVKHYEDGKMRTFEGKYVSIPQQPEYKTLKDYPLIDTQPTYNLRDLGDGVTAICLTTKMGTINPELVGALLVLLESRKLERVVLASEARSFSAGYDLSFFLEHIDKQDFVAIDVGLSALQMLSDAFSSIPSVAAVYGHCLGAGLELAMGCSQIVAQAESQIGLPEAKVGLIPGGSGTVKMRLRAQETARRLTDTALKLTIGTVGMNADEARVIGFLKESDITIYHPDRLITEAKKAALSAEIPPRPEWQIMEGPVGGMIDRAQDERTDLTEHDKYIGDRIKNVFTRSTSYEDALAKERACFLELCNKSMTHARIKHMLDTGKPLRN